MRTSKRTWVPAFAGMSGLACCFFLAMPAAAYAGQEIYSYEPVSTEAHALTETGLSFLFERGLMGSTHIRRLIQTGEKGQAELKPGSEKDLGPGGVKAVLGAEHEAGSLYEIQPQQDGAAFINAVCPGAQRAWLDIGPLSRFQDLAVQTMGRDKGAATARHCATLIFTWHNEWTLPQRRPPRLRLSPAYRPN